MPVYCIIKSIPRSLVRDTQTPSNSIAHSMMNRTFWPIRTNSAHTYIPNRPFMESSPARRFDPLRSVLYFMQTIKIRWNFVRFLLFEYGETYINVQSFLSCLAIWLFENATEQRQLWLLLLPLPSQQTHAQITPYNSQQQNKHTEIVFHFRIRFDEFLSRKMVFYLINWNIDTFIFGSLNTDANECSAPPHLYK